MLFLCNVIRCKRIHVQLAAERLLVDRELIIERSQSEAVVYFSFVCLRRLLSKCCVCVACGAVPTVTEV